MAMTPSQLSIIVKSQGVEQAAKDLDKLAQAAASVDSETKAFVIAQSKLAASNQKVAKSSEATARGISVMELQMIKAHEQANKMAAAMDRQAAAQQRVADGIFTKALKDQEIAANKAADALARQNKEVEKQAGALKTASHHGNIFNNTIRSMATAAIAYMGVNFFAGVIKDADAWSMMQAKLNLAVGGMQMAKVAQKDLYEMSQRVRVPLEDSAKLFTRMSVPLQRMGQSVGEVQKVVESFSMALKLGGATGQEASSAMLQLSQSFNAGRLNGGEFNSVAEAAPSVLRAVETELIRVGKGALLAGSNLKDLAAKGVISTEVMAEALKRAAPKWAEEFKQLPLTVDGAITRIKNAWQKAVGEMGENTKFNEDLAKTLSKLEAELPRIANAIGNALLFVVNNGEMLLKTLGAIVALFATSKIIEASYTFVKLAESIGLVTAAGNLLGLTPIGKIVLGISAVVGAGILVWKNYSDKLEYVTKKQEEYSKTIPDIIAKLEGETRSIAKKNEVLDTELAIRNELEKFNNKPLAREVQMADLSEYKQILANVNLARMRMEDAKSAFLNRKSNEIGSTLEAEVKATAEAFKKAEALMKNPDTFKKAKLAELDRETSGLLAANDARVKASEELINKYKSNNEKAKALRDSAIANLNTQYSQELELQNKNLITAEAYYAAKRGIEREYLESLDKQKKIKKEPSGMFLNQGRDDLYEDTDKRIIDFVKAQEKALKASADNLKAAEDEVAKVKALISGYQDKKQALTDLQISEQEAKLISLDKNIAAKEEVNNISKTIAALKELKGVQTTLTGLDSGKKAFEDYEKFMDSAKVDKFGKSFTDSMGKVGKAVTNVSKVLENMSKTYSNIDKHQGNLQAARESGYITEKQYQQELANLESMRFGTAMNLYGDMAEAAKGFFEEGSKGYKTLDGISKVVHAAQMARNLVEMGQLAVKAVMNQAGGDPYSAWARMGAMAAAMAALGFAVGGGFNKSAGGATATDVQKTQGQGSVFGDASAKSDSVKTSLELLKASFDRLYPVNQGMLKALKNIESSMIGLTNLVVRSGGIVEGSNLGIKEGTISKSSMSWTTALILGGVTAPILKLLGGLWGKTTQNIIDSGLQFGGSLQGMQQGQGFSQYASVDTTKSSWFGLKKDTTNTVQAQGLSNELNNQFAMIFTNMQKSLEEAGKVLYGSSKGVTDALNNMVFEVSKVSLKGLTGQALTDAINGVVSKALDQMAGTALTNLEQFRKVGEGYAQTVIRVANSFSLVNATLDKLGMKLYAMDDAGIKAAMSFTELFDSMEEMQSVASDYYDKFYTEQEKQEKIVDALKKQFTAMNEVLPDSIKAYRELVDNTTDPAKIATLWKLSGAFSEVFGTMESAAKDIPQKMKDAFESLSKDAERWLSLRNQATSLKDSIDEAMGGKKDPTARIKQLWDALAADISPEQKLQLAGELKDLTISKYQVEKESIQKLIDFGRQLRGYVDSLKVGSLSPLTMTEKLAEAQRQYQTTLAKAQGGDVTAQGMLQGKADTYLQLAQTALASSSGYQAIFGDVTASLDNLGIEAMSASEQANVTAANQLAELQRLRDFAVQTETTATNYYRDSLQALTNQINVMDKMYTELGIVNGTMGNLAGLSAEIAAAIRGQVGATGNQDFVNSLYNSYAGKFGTQIDLEGFNYWMSDVAKFGKEYTTEAFRNSVAIVNSAPPTQVATEVASLKSDIAVLVEEIKGLRTDAQSSTGAIIQATISSSINNANIIVAGTLDNNQQQSWAEATTPSLV